MAQAGFLEGSPEEKDVILIVISNQNCVRPAISVLSANFRLECYRMQEQSQHSDLQDFRQNFRRLLQVLLQFYPTF